MHNTGLQICDDQDHRDTRGKQTRDSIPTWSHNHRNDCACTGDGVPRPRVTGTRQKHAAEQEQDAVGNQEHSGDPCFHGERRGWEHRGSTMEIRTERDPNLSSGVLFSFIAPLSQTSALPQGTPARRRRPPPAKGDISSACFWHAASHSLSNSIHNAIGLSADSMTFRHSGHRCTVSHVPALMCVSCRTLYKSPSRQRSCFLVGL